MSEPMIETAVAVNALSGYKLSTVIAGLMGACISLKFGDDIAWWKRLTSVVSSVVLAQYLAPPLVEYFKVPHWESAAAVLIGLFGLSFCAAGFRELKKLDLAGIVSSRLGGGNSGGNTPPGGP